MSIDFDITAGWNVPGRCVWGYHKDGNSHAKIFLCRGECHWCKNDVLNELDYEHILEHEIFEAVVCITAASDEVDPRHWRGFNNLFSPLHYKTKWHFCPTSIARNGSVMVRVG